MPARACDRAAGGGRRDFSAFSDGTTAGAATSRPPRLRNPASLPRSSPRPGDAAQPAAEAPGRRVLRPAAWHSHRTSARHAGAPPWLWSGVALVLSPGRVPAPPGSPGGWSGVALVLSRGRVPAAPGESGEWSHLALTTLSAIYHCQWCASDGLVWPASGGAGWLRRRVSPAAVPPGPSAVWCGSEVVGSARLPWAGGWWG